MSVCQGYFELRSTVRIIADPTNTSTLLRAAYAPGGAGALRAIGKKQALTRAIARHNEKSYAAQKQSRVDVALDPLDWKFEPLAFDVYRAPAKDAAPFLDNYAETPAAKA